MPIAYILIVWNLCLERLLRLSELQKRAFTYYLTAYSDNQQQTAMLLWKHIIGGSFLSLQNIFRILSLSSWERVDRWLGMGNDLTIFV